MKELVCCVFNVNIPEIQQDLKVSGEQQTPVKVKIEAYMLVLFQNEIGPFHILAVQQLR